MNSETNNKKRKSSGAGAEDGGGDVAVAQQSCPYLDTIQRSLLDFDFEPSCSVSLECGPHVYGCLVCGKFFRGRGKNTPAYTHSVDDGHYVFVHLTKGTFHCLPEDYQIHDTSLIDISAALHPTFTPIEISHLDSNTGLARDLFGRRYLPGYVGLNNLHKTDCVNAVVQALVHVRPLRDYFLKRTHKDIFIPTKKKDKPPHRMSHLVQCFGELVRKIWSDKRFKSNVDPHMLVQAVSELSKKKFQVGSQAEAGEFMAWFLNQLHLGLGGSPRKPNSSIIYKCFQGKVEVTTRQRKMISTSDDEQDNNNNNNKSSSSAATATNTAEVNNSNKDAMDVDETTNESSTTSQQQQQTGGESTTEENNNNNNDNEKEEDDDEEEETTVMETNFLQLTLDIPEKPLFRDDDGGLVIPQEPLVSVLKKFDGMTFSDAVNKSGITQQRKKYKLLELPSYLILHLARFKKNQYSREKNPTIVAFPVKNLDLSSYVFPKKPKVSPPTEEEVKNMDVKQLKELLTKYGRQDIASRCLEKSELVEATINFVTKSLPDLLVDKYDLVANITHDSPADVGREGKTDPLQEGSYKCHVCHQTANQWYELQDLHVQETMPQLIGVSESYVLIFERKSAQHQYQQQSPL